MNLVLSHGHQRVNSKSIKKITIRFPFSIIFAIQHKSKNLLRKNHAYVKKRDHLFAFIALILHDTQIHLHILQFCVLCITSPGEQRKFISIYQMCKLERRIYGVSFFTSVDTFLLLDCPIILHFIKIIRLVGQKFENK